MQKPAFSKKIGLPVLAIFSGFLCFLFRIQPLNKSVIMYKVNFGLILKRGAKLRAKARITFFDIMRHTGVT